MDKGQCLGLELCRYPILHPNKKERQSRVKQFISVMFVSSRWFDVNILEWMFPLLVHFWDQYSLLLLYRILEKQVTFMFLCHHSSNQKLIAKRYVPKQFFFCKTFSRQFFAAKFPTNALLTQVFSSTQVSQAVISLKHNFDPMLKQILLICDVCREKRL